MRKKKIVTIVAIASLSLVTIAGCGKDKEKNKNKVNQPVDIVTTNDPIDVTNDPEATDEGVSTVDQDKNLLDNKGTETTDKDDKDQNKDDQTSSNETSKKTVELPIYTINDETLETEDTIATIPADENVTAKVIVDEVVKAFSANSYEVNVDSVSQDNDTVVVNFKKNSPPTEGVGASVEATTLDCISHSILDNLKSCKAVVFRIEGEAYVSGHLEFGINEPYSTGNTN